MGIVTLGRYLMGDRQAILEIAASPLDPRVVRTRARFALKSTCSPAR